MAAIGISSWHVGSYMATFDGWIMASIMGATLGFCNFLCAKNIFEAGSTSRFPSFVGLVFFAVTSTWMQYTYFNINPNIGTTWAYGVNMDALVLGLWAPAAEILLGWIYAAGSSKANTSIVRPERSAVSKWSRLAEAVTVRVERQLSTPNGRSAAAQNSPTPDLSIQPLGADTNQPNGAYQSFPQRETANANNGTSIHLPTNGQDSVQMSADSAADKQPNGRSNRSSAQLQAAIVNAYRQHPNASYAEIGTLVGCAKSTVSNHVRQLQAQDVLQKTDEGIIVVAPDDTGSGSVALRAA